MRVELCVLAKALPRLKHAADDLVVHVGYVNHVIDLIAQILQIPAQHVDGNEGPEITDVTVVINRRRTGVHAHLFALERLKLFDFCGECVVKTQGHG